MTAADCCWPRLDLSFESNSCMHLYWVNVWYQIMYNDMFKS